MNVRCVSESRPISCTMTLSCLFYTCDHSPRRSLPAFRDYPRGTSRRYGLPPKLRPCEGASPSSAVPIALQYYQRDSACKFTNALCTVHLFDIHAHVHVTYSHILYNGCK